MGIFDFLWKPKGPTQTASEFAALKTLISSTNNMIKLQLITCINPQSTYEDLFEDLFFLGYFYGIHDAAFQKAGHQKSQTEMYASFMLAIGDFCNADAVKNGSAEEIADEIHGLIAWLRANEDSSTFQLGQLIALTEYFELLEGRIRSLTGLISHFGRT